GAIALCGALGMALALAVTGAHLRTPVAGDAPVARPDFVPVRAEVHAYRRRGAGGSPGAVRHRCLLRGRGHDRSNAPHLVWGAGDRPSSDRRSHARVERRPSPSVAAPGQIHTVAWVNKWSQRAMKSL